MALSCPSCWHHISSCRRAQGPSGSSSEMSFGRECLQVVGRLEGHLTEWHLRCSCAGLLLYLCPLLMNEYGCSQSCGDGHLVCFLDLPQNLNECGFLMSLLVTVIQAFLTISGGLEEWNGRRVIDVTKATNTMVMRKILLIPPPPHSGSYPLFHEWKSESPEDPWCHIIMKPQVNPDPIKFHMSILYLFSSVCCNSFTGSTLLWFTRHFLHQE